tara:strand:+ start:465 stop:1532 length:1068 start_codon:yes stop_codon:yes gene_type:complete
MVAPADAWLGIAKHRHSPGVREMCCREATSDSFRHAAEDLLRVGQIRLSHDTVRTIVEAEGRRAVEAQQRGYVRPDWSAEDCQGPQGAGTCLITGADGVKVPLVTETEKAKRRALRRRSGPKARRRRRRMRRGSDQAYKEFKLVVFYDPSKAHQYAVGTSRNHKALGRLMRRTAGWLKLDQADVSYSVTDGAEWIRNQYNRQLPMLEANVLDYYHLREHVIAASHAVFGQSTPEAIAWREDIMGVVLQDGPLALLDRVGDLRRSLRAKVKREELESLRKYVAKRVEMLEYPTFKAKNYEIGSGPTEAFCKTLTSRLKGPGMRWDRRHAEALMALAATRSSGMWKQYWTHQRLEAA